MNKTSQRHRIPDYFNMWINFICKNVDFLPFALTFTKTVL